MVYGSLCNLFHFNPVCNPILDENNPLRVFHIKADDMKIWLIIINNFIHDLFTGFWISTILVIYLLEKKVPFVPGISAEALKDVMKVFFGLGIFSLLIIITTGIFRSINYKFTNSKTFGPVKKKILIAKHILLGLIFLGGTYLAYSYTFN